jgi:hypothetical protein
MLPADLYEASILPYTWKSTKKTSKARKRSEYEDLFIPLPEEELKQFWGTSL